MTMPPRTLVLLGAFIALTAACGSTVQVGTDATTSGGVVAQPDGDAGNGLALSREPVGADDTGTTADDTDTSAAPTMSGGTAPTVEAGTAGGADATGPSRGSSGPTAPPETPPSRSPAEEGGQLSAAPGAPGITDEQIYIGFTYADDAGAANAAIGYEEFSRGDQRRNHEVMLEHINSTGGIAGREVVPIFHVWSEADNQSMAEREQQMCATWTQDNEVFAASVAVATDNLRQCLDNAGVALITVQGLALSDDRTFADFPYTVEPTNLSLNPMARLTVDGLAAQDFYAPTSAVTPAKVGVITYDFPSFRRAVQQDLMPALEARGIETLPPVFVQFQHRASDAGEISAQLSNTVLRFRSEGVTHVHIFEMNALLTVLFLNNAEPQGYRPRYGFNTQNGGQLLVGSVPEAQLQGALSVGWLPLIDVLELPEWPARQRCLELFEEGGVQFSSKNAEGIGMNFCDMYGVLRRGIENAPGPLDRATLTRGLENLGTSWESAMIDQVRLAPGRRFGVSSYRFSEYASECECFRYTDGPFPID